MKVPRRSTRIRKQYNYRGIKEYVDLSSEDEEDYVFNADNNSTETTEKQARTLTYDSDLDEVVRKGETLKQNRTTKNKNRTAKDRKMKAVKNPSEVQLPSTSVMDFSQVLQSHRPLVPELVQTDRCQWLDRALQDFPLVLRPRPQVADDAEGRDGGGDTQGGQV